MSRESGRKTTVAARMNRLDKLSGNWEVPGEESARRVAFGFIAATMMGALFLVAVATGLEMGR